MQISVPQSDHFPQTRLTVQSPSYKAEATCDDSHKIIEVPLPLGVTEDDVEITSCYLGRDGQPAPGCGEVLVKAAVPRPQVHVEALVEPPVSVDEPPQIEN
jgi:hypothetical protein